MQPTTRFPKISLSTARMKTFTLVYYKASASKSSSVNETVHGFTGGQIEKLPHLS